MSVFVKPADLERVFETVVKLSGAYVKKDCLRKQLVRHFLSVAQLCGDHHPHRGVGRTAQR